MGHDATIPVSCFVLEVNAPGLLVVKHHRGEESGKYVNVAVLEGDHLKMIDERASSLPDCPPLLASLLGFDAPASWTQSLNVLVQLAASMRAHKRGGALLVVPSGAEAWRASIVQPILYAIRPFFSELAELMSHPAAERRRWQEAMSRAVDIVAGLTAVDGATIITDRYELLAFGAKIGRRDDCAPRRVRHHDGTDRGVGGDHDQPHGAGWHATPFGGPVRPRSAGLGRARGVAGWPLHGVCLVTL